MKMKKFLVAIFVFIYTFVSVMYPCKEAKAIDPVSDAIDVNMIPAVASLIVAAGISLSSTAVIENIVRWWYSEQGQETREALSNTFLNIVDGVMSVPSVLWQAVKTWVQEKFYTSGAPVDEFMNIDGLNIGRAAYIYLDGEVVLREVVFNPYEGKEGRWELHINGEYVSNIGYREYGYTDAFQMIENGKVHIVYIRYGKLEHFCSPYFPHRREAYAPGLTYTPTIEVLQNPDWTVEKVLVPEAVDSLVGSTYMDVVVEGDGVGEIPTEGTISRILDKVTAIAETLTTGLVGDIGSITIPQINISLSDKFPFSLPWDVARIFGLLNSSPKSPVFQTVLGGPFKDTKLRIDVSEVFNEQLMEKIRFFELLTFCVGLVIITPRLMGGAK